MPSPDAGPEAAYARSVLLEELDAALDELPEEQREVFVAHELMGNSFKEISAQTGCECEHAALAETLCRRSSCASGSSPSTTNLRKIEDKTMTKKLGRHDV